MCVCVYLTSIVEVKTTLGDRCSLAPALSSSGKMTFGPVLLLLLLFLLLLPPSSLLPFSYYYTTTIAAARLVCVYIYICSTTYTT